MGELQVTGGVVFAESVTEIVALQPSALRRLGYLVSRSTISVNPPAVLSRLVGSDATIAIGNKSGSVWTDLTQAIPAPPVDLAHNGVQEYIGADGRSRLGAVADIRGTPWAVWVEFPRPAVVAQARTSLNRMLVIGALVIGLGILLVRGITQRVTTPLIDLTRAAEAIAVGDYARRVTIDRRDEISRLGTAFNTMGAEIEEVRHRLERQVLERTEALAALRESEDDHRAIVEVAFDCIITIDTQGFVTEFNPAAERTFKYTRADVLGRELAVLIVPPSLRQAHREGLARFLATGQGPLIGRLIEITAMRADGTKFPVELTISAIRSSGGGPRVTAVVRDITQRKQAERALVDSERAYRSTFDEAPIGIAHLTLTGGWLRANRRLCDLLGYPEAELMTADFRALAHPEDAESDTDARAALMTGALDRHTGVRRYRRKDGQYIWVNLMTSLYRDAAGAPGYFIAIVEDISERRLLEEQLRQAHKMEAIGRLAGGVAHDFNNLLTAILGYSNFVLEQLGAGHPARADVEEIQKAGERASSLTHQLLAFSRRQMLQPQIVDLNAIVGNVDTLLRRLIGEDIALASHLGVPLDFVSVDPGQVEQIILNLAVNARDAMSTGGQLTIETRNLLLDDAYVAAHPGASQGPHVMLAVFDSGAGMSAETMSHVFEPFFTTKSRGEGTGLGLATVYGIVKQSGGSIAVSSELGRGSVFRVYFPRTSAGHARPVSEPPARSTALGGAETILLAEDQVEVRVLATRVLTRYGYTVLEAGSGAEALQIVQKHEARIDLLLTDVIMPVMNGRELAATLQRTHPEIRVLYASGYTDDAIGRRGMLDPSVAFLEKPFTPKSLLMKVREVLDQPAPGAGEKGRVTDTPA